MELLVSQPPFQTELESQSEISLHACTYVRTYMVEQLQLGKEIGTGRDRVVFLLLVNPTFIRGGGLDGTNHKLADFMPCPLQLS